MFCPNDDALTARGTTRTFKTSGICAVSNDDVIDQTSLWVLGDVELKSRFTGVVEVQDIAVQFDALRLGDLNSGMPLLGNDVRWWGL